MKIKTMMFFASMLLLLVFVTMSVTPAYAGKYLSRSSSREMLEGLSIHFERSSPSFGHVRCYKKITTDIRSGSKPLCWSNDIEKHEMTIAVSVVSESVSDEILKDNVFGRIYHNGDYSAKLLAEQNLPSGMEVRHYRVSWPFSSSNYEPYISTVRFNVMGNKVLVAFFNESAEKTDGAAPIQDNVMKFISEGKIAPIR